MEINLSEEMIEKIACVAFGRRQSLRKMIEEVEKRDTAGYRDEAIKRITLKDLNKALDDAEEVHSLFWGMMEELGLVEETEE